MKKAIGLVLLAAALVGLAMDAAGRLYVGVQIFDACPASGQRSFAVFRLTT